MSAEIRHNQEDGTDSLLPGNMIEIDTPVGVIQIIGTQNGFAVRRQNSGLHDVLYKEGETFTLSFEGQPKTVIKAVKPESWEAHPVLDSQH